MGRWMGVCPEWSPESCWCSASPRRSASQDLGQLSSLSVPVQAPVEEGSGPGMHPPHHQGGHASCLEMPGSFCLGPFGPLWSALCLCGIQGKSSDSRLGGQGEWSPGHTP